MKERVFVSQPIPGSTLDLLRQVADVTVYPYMDRQITVDELAANARRADWLFVMHETNVPAEVLHANPGLKGIGALARHDPTIDMETANALKIPIVVEDPADNGVQIATADLTMAMVLSLAYRLPDADRYTRAGKFKQEQTMALMGIGCPGKTLGLIGMGQVAEQIPARARPFGLKVIYTKRNQLSRERETELGVEFRPNLVDLLRESDFVCVACDYNVSTHKLIGEKELAFMRSDAYLINTARGRIVDEEALIRALQNKKIAGAGLDVFWNEPPHTEEPSVPDELCKLDNVLMAPHNGGATWDSRGLRTKSVADGLIQLIRGQRPKFLLNPQIYDEP